MAGCRVIFAWLILVGAGCRAVQPRQVAVDWDARLAEARRDGQSMVVLIETSTPPGPRSFSTAAGVRWIVIDLDISANRPTAARYHVADADAPVLIALTPRGLVVDRRGPPVTPVLERRLADEAAGRSRTLDAALAALEQPVMAHPSDAAARLRLAAFLRSHDAVHEALPHWSAVAHDATVDVQTRVRAWVEMGRGHLWVGEPEKARHAAQSLIDTLGPQAAEARAGGELIRGMQDVRAKRYGRASDELAAAVAAAPQSAYGQEAAALLRELPAPGR